MSRTPEEDTNRRMLRARDAMDRAYAEPLDIPALARIAHVSQAHFTRTLRATFGETPHRHLRRRRVERAMFLRSRCGRPTASVTEICFHVGFSSLGAFSRTCRAIAGHSPRECRKQTLRAVSNRVDLQPQPLISRRIPRLKYLGLLTKGAMAGRLVFSVGSRA